MDFDILKKIDKLDLELLHNIYLWRCLNISQAYETFYIDKYSSQKKFFDVKVKKLISSKIIEIVDYINEKKEQDTAIFLTNKGIDIVKHFFEIPIEIIDSKTKNIKKGYYTASELKMNPKIINHQINLNDFVIRFKKRAKDINLKWKYYDEKFLSQYVNIRPDGLIRIMNTDFFLEMDMCTESKKQLIDKWNNYRGFSRSNEFLYRERKLIILFIIEGKNVENRKDIVKLSSSEVLLDMFGRDFDLYAGSKEEILKLLFEYLIPDIQQISYKEEELRNILNLKFGFSVADGEKLRKSLHDTTYCSYIRKINTNNTICMEDGRLQEYLLDNYNYEPMSVLTKIAYHSRNSSMFNINYGRHISYIIILDDIEKTIKDLSLLELLGTPNIYFTTVDRLKNLNFYEAIFTIDTFGNMYHFKDMALEKQVYEKSFKLK